MARTSRRDMLLRRTLTIGQPWVHRGDEREWTVRQVYRKDNRVLMCTRDGARQIVTFDDLRADWGRVP